MCLEASLGSMAVGAEEEGRKEGSGEEASEWEWKQKYTHAATSKNADE